MEQRLIRLEILNRDFHWSSSIFITEEFFSTPKGLSSSYPSAAVLHQQCLTASLRTTHASFFLPLSVHRDKCGSIIGWDWSCIGSNPFGLWFFFPLV
jgi:hypothetical protein